MKLVPPSRWTDGMLLDASHFLLQQEYHDTQLRYVARLLLPYCWGVKSITIDEDALKRFLFEIEKCEVITPEGVVLKFSRQPQSGTMQIKPCSFEQDLPADGRPLPVYLGIRRSSVEPHNIANVDEHELSDGDAEAADVTCRFLSCEAERPDYYAEDEYDGQQLIYNGQLLLGG